MSGADFPSQSMSHTPGVAYMETQPVCHRNIWIITPFARSSPQENPASVDGGFLPGGTFGGVMALAIAHNPKQTLTVERTQTEKPAPPARPKNFEPTRRNILADSLTPRAPPD